MVGSKVHSLFVAVAEAILSYPLKMLKPASRRTRGGDTRTCKMCPTSVDIRKSSICLRHSSGTAGMYERALPVFDVC